MKTTYTFNNGYMAHTVKDNRLVTIPDIVATNQEDFDGKTFPILKHDGTKCRATLRGDLYGLWTSGTGDPIVSIT